MEVIQLQFLFMGVIFILNTCVGLAPVLLGETFSTRLVPRASVRSRILSCASCFGAGVFIFVCFMGLLPAADSKFHHFLEELGHLGEEWEEFVEFPWGFFVVTCGFLIIFTIDKLVHAMDHSRSTGNGSQSSLILETKNQRDPLTLTCHEGNTQVTVHQYDLHESHDGHGVPSSVIFLAALGTHSLFEGMAVGLQDQREKVLEFSVAVLVHEVVMAFTFGMEVSKSSNLGKWSKVLYVIIFTITIPTGILAGVLLQNAPSDNREIVSAVFEAFATGIFIHVIFIEVLTKEFPAHQHHHQHPEKNTDEDQSLEQPSETCLLMEKIVSICCGILTLILLNLFMHSHH